MSFSGFAVRSEYASEAASSLLRRSVRALSGVSEVSASALENSGISTILDLGASGLFNAARQIARAAEGPDLGASVAGDLVDSGYRAKSASEVLDASIAALRGVGKAEEAKLATALSVTTIRELANWPPFLAAASILQEAYGMSPSADRDPERPEDLIPVPRRYATERVQYDVIVLDKVLGKTSVPGGSTHALAGDAPLRDVINAGGIDISDVVSSALTAKLAIGAVLTYRQSWYPQGLALGHLLHSMALAPGESTRIAMVDWARRVRGRAAEDTTQTEALAADVTRTRAMSEVTASVAREAQQGFSGSTATATQEQYGETTGEASAGFTQPGLFGAIGQALFGGEGVRVTTDSRGTSLATATATTNASGWASSTGERSLNAEMQQSIVDRTHQAANSVRNRRATTVTESSQEESERLSTRVVTNYNHMHALTIQYYEVVQIYRVVVELARKTRCLFLPMRLLTFNNETIKRFRNVIARAALTPDVRALAWLQPNQVLVAAPAKAGPWGAAQLATVARAIGDEVGAPGDTAIVLPGTGLKILGVGRWGVRELFSEIRVELRDGSSLRYPIAPPSPEGETAGIWGPMFPEGGELRTSKLDAQEFHRFSLVRRTGKEAEAGVIEVGLYFDVFLPNGRTATQNLDEPTLVVTVPIRYEKDQAVTVAFELAASVAQADVIDHLNQNALHYSSAIWRSLDAATMTTMLSSYSFNGRPLIEQIDPVPVAVTGNYVVFRTYADASDEAWLQFLEKHDLLDPGPLEDMVPLPSGGVFAEAVLGRSNSAEKLDITRFWNWQDSPIPILPPEISPLTAGGKAADPNVQTANLEGRVLNIVNPPSLPDPTGLAPLYSAIANGNMFRDMSGLAQIAALTQSALQAAQTGAADATTAAGQAQQVAATQLTEFLKLIAQVAMTAIGASGGALGGIGGAVAGSARPGVPNTPTNAGALINQGRNIDERLPISSAPAEPPAASQTGPEDEWLPYPGGEHVNTDSAETAAFRAALSGSPEVAVSRNQTLADAVTAGATAVIGGAAIRAGLKKAGVAILGKVVDQTISNPAPVGGIDFHGIEKAHVLLQGYEKPEWYFEVAPEQTLTVILEDLGGGTVSDGLSGGIEVKWTLVALNPDRLRSGYVSEVRKEILDSVFYRDVTVEEGPQGLTVGRAIEKVKISATIDSHYEDPRILLVGGRQRQFVSASVRLMIELQPSTLGGFATGSPLSAPVTLSLRPGRQTVVDNKESAIDRRFILK